jgi:hypothetical protein
MKLLNLKFTFLLFLSCIFLTNVSFSIGLFDKGEFTNYINIENPKIKIELIQNPKSINVSHANLTRDGTSTIISVNKIKAPFTTFSEIFKLEDDTNSLTLDSKVSFELFVFDNATGERLFPQGNILKFNIKFDNSQINLIEKKFYLKKGNSPFILNFNKKIKSYKIKNGTQIVYELNSISENLKNYKNSFEITLGKEILKSSENKFVIEYEDIYGNSNEEEIMFYIKGTNPLKITLITNQEDSSLKYYYTKDKQFEKFYLNNTEKILHLIGVGDFNLKIKTDKKSICKVSKNNHQRLSSTSDGNLFSTTDNLNFNVNIPSSWKYLKIFCYNLNFENSIISFDYLKIFRSLKKKFETIFESPKNVVTSNPFNLFIKTNKEAICFFKNNNIKSILTSTDSINHIYLGISRNSGNNNINFVCYDKLHSKIDKTINFQLNLSSIKLIDYSPKYTFRNSANLNFQISEKSECYVSRTEISDIEVVKSLSKTIGNNTLKTTIITNLEKGDNKFFVYCIKDGEKQENTLNIIYDSEKPKIENLTFLDSTNSKVSFLNTYSMIKFKVDKISKIPISKYLITLKYKENETKKLELSDSPILSINQNIEDLISLTIIPVNALNISGIGIDKAVKFDFEVPKVEIPKTLVSRKLEISSSDNLSGVKSVLYGFSTNEDSCAPNKEYKDSIITYIPDEFNYICTKVYDNANNFKILTREINPDIEIQPLPVLNVSPIDSQIDSPIIPETPEECIVDCQDQEIIIPESNSNSNFVLYLSIFLIVLILLIVGIYYSWNKKILDKYITKYLVNNKNLKIKKFGLNILKNKISQSPIDNQINQITQINKPNQTNQISKNTDKIFNNFNNPQKNIEKKSLKTRISGIFNSNYHSGKNIFDTFSNKKNNEENEKNKDKYKNFYDDVNKNNLKDQSKSFENFYKNKHSK